jgi:hypothetical protein
VVAICLLFHIPKLLNTPSNQSHRLKPFSTILCDICAERIISSHARREL